MANDNVVPKISTSGNEAQSTSGTPVSLADTCACWSDAEIKNARKMLTRKQDVVCIDATAYVALTAVAMDMLIHGKTVKATIVKGWEKK